MRAHRSHSQLNAYLWCGHQYYLTRVLRKPEGPSIARPAGKAFHAATEAFDWETWEYDQADLIVASDDTRWEDKFTEFFEADLDELRSQYPDESTWRAAGKASKEKPNKEDVAWWRVAGRGMVTAYIDWRVSTADTWGIASVNGAPGIEVEVTSALGDVPMKGYIDRVLQSKIDDRLVVGDLKTGSRTPASPMQLATYSVQLEELISRPVLWGAWYDARKGRLGEPINLSKWTKSLLGRVYDGLDRGITAEVFLPNIDTHCGSCGVRQFCAYQGGNEVG